jgi:hypothetical protein
MKKKDLEAVKRMYNALMAVGAVDLDFFASHQTAFRRTQEIVNTCLSEMNKDHTQLIAKAIGLEGKRG